MTYGAKRLALAYTVVSLGGAAVGIAMLAQLGDGLAFESWPSPFEIWTVIACAIGAAAGLHMGRDHFGHPGPVGFLRAVLACLWVSFLGSLIGGTLALPIYGTMFGPLSLAATLITRPLLALVWFGNLFACHVFVAYHRAERDSVFNRLGGEDLA